MGETTKVFFNGQHAVIERDPVPGGNERFKVSQEDGTVFVTTAAGLQGKGPSILAVAALLLRRPKRLQIHGRFWNRKVSERGQITLESEPETPEGATTMVQFFEDRVSLVGPDIFFFNQFLDRLFAQGRRKIA